MSQLRSALGEALLAVGARPGRAAMVALGTILGMATFVATLGASVTVANQIRSTFDASLATEIRLTAPVQADFATLDPARALRVDGAEAAGRWGTVDLPGLVVSRSWAAATTSAPLVYAAGADTMEVIRPHFTHGSSFSPFMDERNSRVVILSAALARQLRITDLTGDPVVFISDLPYQVIGIYDAVDRHPEVLLTAVIPFATATSTYGEQLIGRQTILVSTRLGAAPVVAGQLPLAISPNAPEHVAVDLPADPNGFFTKVNQDAERLYLTLAVIVLLMGGLSIGIASAFSVVQRTPEIGLRRSIGANSMGIGAQFLFEGGLLGLVGGVIGASLGVIAVVAVSLANDWTPTIPLPPTLTAPAVGGLIGVAASSYASLRATRITPLQALRR